MKINNSVIKKDEETRFALRSLYENFGYSQYKMNKFEEYDLYVRNKNFLVSDKVITFNDVDGKLMALKPDVTLSIVKNVDNKESVQKVYYDENVYRAPNGAQSFKEIMQVGLECIGDVDDYCVYEVILLALKSLQSISEDFVLDISNIGVVSEIIEKMNVNQVDKKKIINCISQKNVHDLSSICQDDILQKLIATYGTVDAILPVLQQIYPDGLSNSAKQLVNVVSALEKEGYKNKIRIDFSVLNDMNYYSGIVFKGFINGIPSSILSGGQYDHLMKKLKKDSKAIGFAVYLDMLQDLVSDDSVYDVDTLVIYENGTAIDVISSVVNSYLEKGLSVLARNCVPNQLKYRQIVKLTKKGGFTVETNA